MMKRALVPAAFVAGIVGAGCGSTTTVTTTVTAERTTGRAAGREMTLYGHIRSLARTGHGFELRFDPALWLTGVTAERAAVEDGRLQPGEPVPNDYYIRDESHRLLTYVVARGARVTVVTRGARTTTPITVAELAQIIAGRNPQHRPLLIRGNHLGFWIRVAKRDPNAVVSLDEQYQP